jgi:hypothetical protein
MTGCHLSRLQHEIARLEASAEAAARKQAEDERRRLNLPSPGTTRWRRKDQLWLSEYLARARDDERTKRQPQIDRLRRKITRSTPSPSP